MNSPRKTLMVDFMFYVMVSLNISRDSFSSRWIIQEIKSTEYVPTERAGGENSHWGKPMLACLNGCTLGTQQSLQYSIA